MINLQEHKSQRLNFKEFKDSLITSLKSLLPKQYEIIENNASFFIYFNNKDTQPYSFPDLFVTYNNLCEKNEPDEAINLLLTSTINGIKYSLTGETINVKFISNYTPGSIEYLKEKNAINNQKEFKKRLKNKLKDCFEGVSFDKNNISIPVDDNPSWNAEICYKTNELYEKFLKYQSENEKNPIKKIVKKIEKDYDKKCKELEKDTIER